MTAAARLAALDSLPADDLCRMAEVALIDTIAKSAASAHSRLKCIWISPLPAVYIRCRR